MPDKEFGPNARTLRRPTAFGRSVFKNGINMHQKEIEIDWTCLCWRPRQTSAGSSGPRRRTRGTRFRRLRSHACSLRHL